MKKIILLFILASTNLMTFSQEEVEETKEKSEPSRFQFGIDMSAYFASKSYSQFLDGSHHQGVARSLTNYYTKPIIEERLGYPIKGWEYSGNTTYDISLGVGGFAGFKLQEDLSIVAKFNFAILKMSAPVVLELNDPGAFTGSYVETSVTAQEQRFDVGLGFEKEFEIESKIKPFASFGVNMNYIQLEKHNYNVSGLNYNIIRILRIEGPAGNQQITYKKVDGFGYGVFAEIGAKYKLNDKYSAALGINAMLQSNRNYVENLGLNSNYNEITLEEASGYKLNTLFYVRIIWN